MVPLYYLFLERGSIHVAKVSPTPERPLKVSKFPPNSSPILILDRLVSGLDSVLGLGLGNSLKFSSKWFSHNNIR